MNESQQFIFDNVNNSMKIEGFELDDLDKSRIVSLLTDEKSIDDIIKEINLEVKEIIKLNKCNKIFF